jgi:membrane associated rhomboid family serine protease
MPLTEMIFSIAILAAAVLAFVQLLRLFATAMRFKTLRKLADRDPASAGSLIAQLNEAPVRSGDDRLAIVLIAIGIAMAAGGLIAVDDRGVIRLAIAASLFPLLVGAALGLRLYLIERRRRASGQ